MNDFDRCKGACLALPGAGFVDRGRVTVTIAAESHLKQKDLIDHYVSHHQILYIKVSYLKPII